MLRILIAEDENNIKMMPNRCRLFDLCDAAFGYSMIRNQKGQCL